MKIKAANAPVSWGVMEVEGWGPQMPYTAFLDELVGAGYQGSELGPYGFMATDPRELGRELRQRQVALISAFVPLRLKDERADLSPVRQAGILLQAMGAAHIVLADAMWEEREAVAGRAAESGIALSEEDWRRVRANLTEATELARRYGLRSVFHHHAGTYIETPAEVERLLELTPVGLCLDTGHYVYGGGDPVEAVRRFGRRVEYLHFKDVDTAWLDEVRKEKLGFLDGVRAGVFCELGQGCVRFRDLLAELEKIDYDGWAVVEQDIDPRSSEQRPLECARASRRYLTEALGI